MAVYWTWDEYTIVREEYPERGVAIIDKLPSRSATNIESRAERLGTRLKTPFTDYEKELAKKYGPTLQEALIFLLPKRSPVEIKELLLCVGL